MPRNNRPDTYLGGLDIEWLGSTLTERKLAQNQYDIEEQLEILNRKLDGTKDNSYDKQYELEEQKKQIDYRKNILASYLNITRDILDDFLTILDNGSKEIKKEQNKIDEIKEQKLNLAVDKSKKSSVMFYLLMLALIINAGGLILLPFCAFGAMPEFTNFFYNKYVPIWIIYDIVYFIVNKFYFKKLDKYYEKEYDKYDDEELNIRQEKLNYTKKKLSMEQYNNFKEFRKKHYNREIEEQFSKLNYKFGKIEYSFYDKDDGTIQDYTNYILKTVGLE